VEQLSVEVLKRIGFKNRGPGLWAIDRPLNLKPLLTPDSEDIAPHYIAFEKLAKGNWRVSLDNRVTWQSFNPIGSAPFLVRLLLLIAERAFQNGQEAVRQAIREDLGMEKYR
jgi:hypothetical protein